MINKLMRMEERIVLDGSVAAVVSTVTGGTAGADDAHESSNSFDPIDGSHLDSQPDDSDSTNNSGDDSQASPTDDQNSDDNNLTNESSNFLADVLSQSDDFAPELRAIIVNTDLADSSDLIDAISDDILVITYSGESDSLQNILDSLDQASGGNYFDSIAIAAHSNAGGEIFLLNGEHVSAQSLSGGDTDQVEFFSTIGNFLANDGRIDLLSCYSGLGTSGNALVNAIKGISGRDVAASTDLTGNAPIGGDWILENGDIDAMALYFDSDKLSSYDATLQAPDQTLDGNAMIDADIQLGLELDYFDYNNDGDGVLAVTGFDTDNDTRYVRIYREDTSENSYTLETTIWGDSDDDTFGKSIAIGHDSNGEVLVVGAQTGVYIFEQNTTGQSDNDWSDIDSLSDATTSKAFANVDSVDIIGTTVAVGDTANNCGKGIIDIYLKDSAWNLENTPDSSITITGISGASGFGLGAMLVDVESNDSGANGYNTADQVFGYLPSATTSSESGLFYATANEWLGDATLELGLSHQLFAGSSGYTYTFRDLNVSQHSAGASGTWSTATSSGYNLAESIIISYNHSADNLEIVDFLSFATKSDGTLYDTNAITNILFEATDQITTIATGIGMVALGQPSISDTNTHGAVHTLWWDTTINSGEGNWVQSTQQTALTLQAATTGNNDHFGAAIVFNSEGDILIGAPSTGVDKDLQGIYHAQKHTSGFGTYWGTCDEISAGVYENYSEKVIQAQGTGYLDNFGTYMAEDQGVMVVTTNNVDDGFLVYSYQDTDSDNTPDSWIYSRTLSISDFAELGTVNSIYSVAMYGTTFAISVDGTTQDLVYVFNDITNSSRDDGSNESEILSTNTSNTIFGEDIDVVDGAIFVTIRSTNISGASNIQLFWSNAGQYGSDNPDIFDDDDMYRINNESFGYNASCNAEIVIDADKRSNGTNAYSLVATAKTDDHIFVWAWENENGTRNMTTNKEALYFNPYAYGGTSNSNITLTNIAVEENIIIASAPSFSIPGMSNLGAIAVYRGIDGVWTNGTDANDNATLAAVLTAHKTISYAGNIGQTDIDLSDDGGEVFATSSKAGNNAILGWNIEDLSPSKYTAMLINDRIYIESNPTATIASIHHSSTEQLLASYPGADKSDSNASNKGIVDSFNEDYNIPDNGVDVSTTYTPGDPDSDFVDDDGLPVDDLGEIVFAFSEEVYLSYFSDNMEIIITHKNESNEDALDVTISKGEANSLLNGNNTKLILDLNDPMFSDLQLGVTYTIFVPAGMFKDNLGQVNSEPYIYKFTASESGVSISNEHNATGGDDDEDNKGGSEDSGDFDGIENDVSDLLAEILGDGKGDGNVDGFGEDDTNGEGNGEGDSNNNGDNNNGAGPTSSMMVQNPFAELITSEQVSALFNSTIAAYASIGMDNSEIFAMMQDAMGDTITTAALVESCQDLLNAADDLLAMVYDDIDGDNLALSGSGHTAETESIARVIEEASAQMIQARGNALIANDLLRILTINIKGFGDRIAETSFAGGVKRLATSNEEFAYSYEVLNSILKIVKTSKASGKMITLAELNELLPSIEAAALEKSTGLSENGDRASKDVLSFLTRNMQQKGIDRENLQAQVSAVFEQWHNNLGLSTPVTVTNTNIDDIAYTESIPAQAM